MHEDPVKRGIIARSVLRQVKNAGGAFAQVERRKLTHAVTTRKLTALDLDRYLRDLPGWTDDILRGRTGAPKQVYYFERSAIEIMQAQIADGVMHRLRPKKRRNTIASLRRQIKAAVELLTPHGDDARIAPALLALTDNTPFTKAPK